MTAAVSPDAARPRWGVGGWALVAGMFLVGFAQGPLSAVGWRLDYLPGDRIDGRFNLLVLEHGFRWAKGDEVRFWHLPIYYPAPLVTAYSDAHLGSLPFYGGLRAAGLSPERAYQAWFLLPFLLNYVAAAWTARRLGGGPLAAGVCGFVYAFAVTAVQFTVGHGQLGPRFLVPPAVHLAHGWLLAPTSRRLRWLAACLAGQAYLTIYIAYFLGLLVLATWAATAAFNRRDVSWSAVRAGWWKWLVVGVGLAAALTPLVRPYLLAADEHNTVDTVWLKSFTPTGWAWLLSPDLGWPSAWMHRPLPPPVPHPGLPELHLFPGWLPLGGLWVAAVRAFRLPTPPAVLAAAGLLVALFTTRVGGLCLYDPLFDLPGGAGMRALSRVVLVLLFPAGLGLGFLLERAARVRRTVGLAVLVLVVADQAVVPPTGPRGAVWVGRRTPLAALAADTDRLVDLVRRERPDARALCVFPRPTDAAEFPAASVWQMRAAWAATRLGVPTVNGYSGYWPHGWDFFRDYDALLRWLPPERCEGLVVIGEPSGPNADTPSGRAVRAKYPPLPWPDD